MGEDSFGETPDDLLDDLHDTDDGFIADNFEGQELTARDAFFVGSILGNAYEEAMDKKRRRELMRKRQTKREI